ncbi:ATP-binding protein [Ammoniphilus resinae]|uniref:Anti-sigma regulatory factor (Ser/Thr protein kinase) n=1 Tax=Ammoniphilus resinae TaxID=861532 RepID=A0ABS4GPT7_9BACL|nr:ATP-binding protein [Ammoniphilus resinae]MBP1932276.1 anti-sigma regulatory factor (Ser/Thr protein kinase) [Ammoniphilus resinae]
MKRESIQLAPNLEEWGHLKRLVTTFCEENEIADQLNISLQLVCEEWFTNIVVHGYQGKGEASSTPPLIEVFLWINGAGEVTIQFIDTAPAFNPLERQDPDVTLPAEDRSIGGLGIFLIRTTMDSCEYSRIDERNRFTMRKKVK